MDSSFSFSACETRSQIVREVLRDGWIRDCQWLEEVDSTSSLLTRQLRAGSDIALPALRVADRQTAGRGRGDKRWFSPAGCLMCTFAIDHSDLPTDPVQMQQLALVSGLAVAATADQFVDPAIVRLKWPNDLYVAQRKCAGILIESVFPNNASPPPATSGDKLPTRRPAAWLIGIGINIAIDWNAAPEQVRDTAICLQSRSSRPVIKGQVLLELASRLHQTILAWREGTLDWLGLWRQRCLLSGRTMTAQLPGGRLIEGRCLGVDSSGRLQVHTTQGIQVLQSAEIVRWSSVQ